MENNENFVAEQVTEKVEQTTEETVTQQQTAPKTYTQEEVDEIVGKRNARTRAKIEKEYQRRYGGLEAVLKAGTGMESIEEMTGSLQKFYESKGVAFPQKEDYSPKDIEVLAKADAQDIIRAGMEEVVEEVDRLAKLGTDKMTPREKATFLHLAAHRSSEERNSELRKLGVTEDVYGSKGFQDFAGMFQSGTPVSEIYALYEKSQPKKEVQTIGSMKNSGGGDTGVKDYYSFEEASKFTRKDFEKNPALLKAVEKSMTKWK